MTLKRLFFLGLSLVLIQSAASLLVRLLPGDPLEFLIADSDVAALADFRREMGLDLPAWRAALQAPLSAIQGDLGHSLHTRELIAPVIRTRFLSSALLALPAALIALLIALPLGVVAAGTSGSLIDRFCSIFGSVSASLPLLWIAPVSIWAFCVRLPWFDLEGENALPAIVLGVLTSGFWMRLIRERTREGLALPSAQAARARGLAEWKIRLKYGVRIPLGGLISYFMLQFGHLLTGAFVLEVIFNRAGAGTYFIDAILRGDYPAVEAATWITASICLFSNFLGDTLHQWLDPRLG